MGSPTVSGFEAQKKLRSLVKHLAREYQEKTTSFYALQFKFQILKLQGIKICDVVVI